MPFGTVTLNDGSEIPAIAYGTGSKWKGHDVTAYVEQAIEVGFSHLDTAQFYGTEEYVGAAIKESGLSRSELYITTKYSGLKSEDESIDDSLTTLGLDSVDLYLIHNPRIIKDVAKTWSKFEEFKKVGKAKSIGVSNFDLPTLQELLKTATVVPAVNQIFFNPYNYAENKALLEFSAQHGIVTEAYSSLAPITRFPGGPVDAPVNAAAKRIGATPTQVILAWVQAKGVVIVTTSSTKEHMQEYLDVADLPDLTKEEIAAIDEAGAKGPPGALQQVSFRLSGRWKEVALASALVLLITFRCLNAAL